MLTYVSVNIVFAHPSETNSCVNLCKKYSRTESIVCVLTMIFTAFLLEVIVV